MHRNSLRGVLALLALLLLAAPAWAQGTSGAASAGLGAGVGDAGAVAMQPTNGCWVCMPFQGTRACNFGLPGYWNCSYSYEAGCMQSSPGCGAHAMLPLDVDGSAQYVSRGDAIGLTETMATGGPPIRRNCEGVIVARYQTPESIDAVRTRTGSLTL